MVDYRCKWKQHLIRRKNNSIYKFFFPRLTSSTTLLFHLITLSDTCTIGRSTLDEGSARRRGLYNTQHSQDTNNHAPSGIRTRNPKIAAPHIGLDRASTGIGAFKLVDDKQMIQKPALLKRAEHRRQNKPISSKQNQ